MLSEALNALGFTDKVTPQEEKVQIAINTFPWPRSEIVSLSTGGGIGAKKTGEKQYAVVTTDALGSAILDSTEAQLQMVGRGATSTLYS